MGGNILYLVDDYINTGRDENENNEAESIIDDLESRVIVILN